MRICLVVLLLTASILMAFALEPLAESSRATAQVQNSSTQSDMPAQDPLFPTETSKRLPGTDETFARLIAKAENEGPVRVIIGLNTVFRPEGLLPNAQLVEFQREGIARAQDGLIVQLLGFNARSINRFTFIPFIAMELDAGGLTFLKNSPDVSSIEEDLPRPMTLAQSVPLIGGNAAWASGFSGAGQTVAILDSGVDKTHSFLAGKVVSEACYSTNVDSPVFGSYRSVCPGGVTESTNPGSGVNCSTSLNADCAHGTHVAGIAAGKGTSFSGVARDANIISIQVFSNPLSGGRLGAFDSNMVSGLERVQQLSTSFNIAAVNMSIGGGQNFANCDGTSPAMKAAIDNLRSIRIATVISSGNGDENGNGFPNAISFPACISSAISVGSTDDGSFGTTVNAVSNFSNSASFLHLLAPGRWINSSVPGTSFQDFSGTSMAAPHVAGSWAVLRSKAPSATVDQVLQALTSTGLPVTDSKNGLTKPRIRVDTALNTLNRVLTIASSNPGSGVSISVSPVDNSNQGDGVTQFSRTYSLNSTVTLTAPATAGGNNFQKWQRDGVDLTNNLSTNVVMDANYTMTAVYVTPPTQTLTVNSSNPTSGVSISVSPVDNSSQGNGATPFNRTYNLNSVVTLTAPATAGVNNFQKWLRNGTDFSTDLMINVTIDADHTLTAVYVTPTRTLNVASSNPANGVSISVSPVDNSSQGNGATPFNRTYNLNTPATLTAPATAGVNNFQKWLRNGSDFSTDLMVNVTMDADHTLTAVYVTPTRTLNVASSNPANGVSISVNPVDNSSQGNGATPFNRTYNLNTPVTLTAPATAGVNNFQKWLRNGTDWSTNRTTSVTLDTNYTLTAVYVTPTRTLTVASSNPATGVGITVSPNDNSNLGSGVTGFSRVYNLNTNVMLTAPATASGNAFQKWQRNGLDFSTNPSTPILMDANYTLTAVYVTPIRTLTVTSSNPATGVSITVSPNDNSNLGSGATQFNRTYNQNTNVTLTAPDTAGGNNFQKWQRNGIDWSTNRSTSVTMDANYTMTAVYVTPTRTLTVASSIPNSGVSVTVSPNDNANLGSGATPFNRTYNQNTIVTLTAPLTAGGHTFHKWQRNGVDFSINPAINLTMIDNYTMTAVYGTRRLTVASNPNNGVNITVSPNDTSNLGSGPTQFSRIYNLNTTVTLTTPAAAGANIFQKWQRNGVDFSTIRSISVTMDNDYNLMAVYVSPPAPVQTLIVAGTNSLEPRGEGPVSITVSPNDNNNLANGATQFSRIYNHNTTVTLTAPSSPVNPFRKWQRNGLDWSTNPTTTVTMDSNYTMTVVYGGPFAMRTLNVASSNPNSGVSINLFPHDISNQGGGASQFSRKYFSSSAVTLVAPATVGVNTFQKWQRNGVDFSTNRITDVTLDLFTTTMTAVYVSPPTQTLTVASSNPGSGVNITVSPNDNSNLGSGTTQFSRTYSPNTNVTLTAPATVGLNSFQKWQRNGVDWSTNSATSVTLDANYTMTAVYVTPPAATWTLTVDVPNPESGVSITVNPTDNSNQGGGTAPFRRTYNHNTNVMLTAPPAVGDNIFLKWQRNGIDWSTKTLTSVLMDANHTVTAVYVTLSDEPPIIEDPLLAAGFFSSDWTASVEPSIFDWITLLGTDDTAETSGVRTFTMPAQDQCEFNALCRALRVGSRSLYSFY